MKTKAEQRKRWRAYYKANRAKYRRWNAAWRKKQKQAKEKKPGKGGGR